MNITKIRWKNLLSTGNCWTELVFQGPRSNLIIGNNGSGKSTLLDALAYGLYGRAFRKVNKDQLVNSINKKDMVVEIEFIINDKQWKIVRGLKPSVFEIYEDDTLKNQDASDKDLQEYVEKNIIGMNYKAFSQIVVIGSASYTPFMELSAPDRRAVIEDLLDLQIFSVMGALLKQRQTDNNDAITKLNGEIVVAEKKIELHHKYLNSLKQTNTETIQNLETKLKEYNVKLLVETTEMTKLQSDYKFYENKIKDNDANEASKKEWESVKDKIETKLKRKCEERNFYCDNDNCPTCKQDIDNSLKEVFIKKFNIEIIELEVALGKVIETLQKIYNRQDEIIDMKVYTLDVLRDAYNKHENEAKILAHLINEIISEKQKLEQKGEELAINEEEDINLKFELLNFHETKEELINNKHILDTGNELLKDGGIKSKIVKQYVPEMNKLINNYLAKMDFLCQFELNEKFEEVIRSRFRDEFSYASFSEGEKIRLDFSLLFTWRAIAKLRNSATINILIIDECFDSSLDAAGVDDFLKILKVLTQDTDTYIISHKSDLIDKFDNVIRFEKKRNFSSMVTKEPTL